MKNLFYLFFVCVFVLSTTSMAQVVSDFETDIEGWYSEGDGEYIWELGTGNPGNNFRVNDDATGSINLGYAPAKFLGDWSNATSSDFLSADIYLHQINGGYISDNFVFQIEGPGGKARALSGTNPPFYTWETYSVPIDPASWTILEGNWPDLMQFVNTLIVRMEYISGNEWVRLDNVDLSFTPVVVPVTPEVCSDFEAGGFDGWSFTNTGSVTNQAAGGNPGRYLRITDASGTSIANAPPKFLGDWNQLDNHAAEIQVDLIVTDFSGSTFLHDFFIQLEGPGGTAIFPTGTFVEEAFNKWHTFVFPVDISSWTVTSGSWSGLISNVTSLKMVVEFISGSEVVGMDNFCITDMPPVADFTATPTLAFRSDPIQFSDLSRKGPYSWSWDFGDSQTSNLQNPVHSYLSPGIFDVSLTVTNNFGTDNITKNAYIEIVDDSQCTRLEDDFNDGAINPVWKTINGTWSESGGLLRQTSNYYVSGNYLGGCFAITGSSMWQDYVVSFDFLSTDNDGIGLVFNYQDEQNMYMFFWRMETNERKLFRWENGVFTILAEDNVPYAMNVWYHAEIAAIEGNLSVKIDGMEIFNVNDNVFTAGKTGLYCWANQQSHYDNFVVSCAGVEVDVKVLLEGPFQGAEMITDLNSNGYLPLIQPYSGSPWNYGGIENIAAIPNNDICDWVLLELRDAPDATSALPPAIVGQQAAFILKNGSVVATDGVSPVRFSIDVNDHLFAVVRHRNHIPVMSANPLSQNGGLYVYDFSAGAGQAFGGSQAHKEIAAGTWGMIAADGNSDSQVNNSDKNDVWAPQAGSTGYLQGDFNLDTQVNNADKNELWKPNTGLGGQVPDGL